MTANIPRRLRRAEIFKNALSDFAVGNSVAAGILPAVEPGVAPGGWDARHAEAADGPVSLRNVPPFFPGGGRAPLRQAGRPALQAQQSALVS